jgi:hypothetical protein
MISWLWSIVHNCMIHPLMPFLPFDFVDNLHDWTAKKAFNHES